MYDVSNPASYDNTTNWLKEMISITGRRPIVLVGNKIDLRSTVPNCLTMEDGLRKARELSSILGMDVPYIEASAKVGTNVSSVFLELGRRIINYAVETILRRKSAVV